MSSIIYNSCLYNVFRSNTHFDTDQFKIILVSDEYKPSKMHSKRSDVIGEIPSGEGYIQGGLEVDVNVNVDNRNDRVNISLGKAIWMNATITASGAVYYKMGGGGAATDDLVCFIEFLGQTRSENGNFTVTPSVLRIQN